MPTILLVDDAPTVLMFEKMLLSPLGYTLITAGNGQEALDKVKQTRPDLIFMDLNMPVMDGLTCLKELRKLENTKDLPIILVTTVSEKDRVNECLEAGCTDFIFKPFRKAELHAKIKQYIIG